MRRRAAPDDRRDPVRRRGEDGEGRRGRQGGLRRHPHRPGEPGHVPEDPRRLLRRADPAAAARVVPEPRGAHHHHQPVRQVRDARHREGDPAGRPRRQPEQRRHDHPLRDAGAHRGAAPRVRQDGATPRPRTPRSRSATSAARPRTTLEKLVKDGEVGEDEGSRAEKELETRHQEARRPRSTTCSSARRPSSSRSERRHDDDRRPSRHRRPHRRRSPTPRTTRRSARPAPDAAGTRRPRAGTPKAGRDLRAAVGVGLLLGGPRHRHPGPRRPRASWRSSSSRSRTAPGSCAARSPPAA